MNIKGFMTGLLGSLFGMLTACGQQSAMPEGALLNIEYTIRGTMAEYIFEGRVTAKENGDVELRVSSFGQDSVVVKNVDAKALADLRKIIEEEKMYAYKSSYEPPFEVLDGTSWSFFASFQDDQYIMSGGSNAEPQGNGLARIREYMTSLGGYTQH